jgi:hypothetical protein
MDTDSVEDSERDPERDPDRDLESNPKRVREDVERKANKGKVY